LPEDPARHSPELEAKLPTHGHRGALQSVQRDTGIAGIEQAIKGAAARLHSRCHGSFCETFFLHRGFDLIRQDLLDGLFFTFAKYSLFGQEFIE
jgi:hypothetical protein